MATTPTVNTTPVPGALHPNVWAQMTAAQQTQWGAKKTGWFGNTKLGKTMVGFNKDVGNLVSWLFFFTFIELIIIGYNIGCHHQQKAKFFGRGMGQALNALK